MSYFLLSRFLSFFFSFSFFFPDKVLQCSSGCPETHSINQFGLELTYNLLPLPLLLTWLIFSVGFFRMATYHLIITIKVKTEIRKHYPFALEDKNTLVVNWLSFWLSQLIELLIRNSQWVQNGSEEKKWRGDKTSWGCWERHPAGSRGCTMLPSSCKSLPPIYIFVYMCA